MNSWAIHPTWYSSLEQKGSAPAGLETIFGLKNGTCKLYKSWTSILNKLTATGVFFREMICNQVSLTHLVRTQLIFQPAREHTFWKHIFPQWSSPCEPRLFFTGQIETMSGRSRAKRVQWMYDNSLNKDWVQKARRWVGVNCFFASVAVVW